VENKSMVGSFWEFKRNMLGIKENNLPPTQNLKEKNQRMLSLPIGCMKFLFPKLFVTIFGLG
jgi:hypothetical protein